MTVPSRVRALGIFVLVGLASSLPLSAAPVAAAQETVNLVGGTEYHAAIPVQGNGNNFSIAWQPGGNGTDILNAEGTLTLSKDQNSYTIAGKLSISTRESQNCNYFHGGTKFGVRRDGEEWDPSGTKRWGWKLISEERGCNDLQRSPVNFTYTGKWDVGDERVLIDIRSNPIVGSYNYSGNAKCERWGEKFNC
jgi:hypothetical protein